MYTDAKLHGEKVREKMLSFIVNYIEEHQYSPTVKEIGHGVGLKSNSSVVSHMIRLREEGKINYIDYQPRTITVLGYDEITKDRTNLEYCNRCGFIKPQCICEKPKTNADRIRSMTDEELANENVYFVSEFVAKEGLRYTGLDGHYYRTGAEVVEANRKWLQSEVEV